MVEAAGPDRYLYHPVSQLGYKKGLELQQGWADQLVRGCRNNGLIVTEHPPLYTCRPSARRELGTASMIEGVPVYDSDRGGQITYHGPGQMIAYVIRNLRGSLQGVRRHVTQLEESVIRTLACYSIEAQRDAHYPGVWVEDRKIAALGVRIRRGVTYHGIALNRDVDLAPFRAIVPCGIPDRGVTSMAQLGVDLAREELENRFCEQFLHVFQAQWIE